MTKPADCTCGGQAKLAFLDVLYCVMCSDCEHATKVYEYAKEAIGEWEGKREWRVH